MRFSCTTGEPVVKVLNNHNCCKNYLVKTEITTKTLFVFLS